MTKLEYLLLIEKIILYINETLNHDLKCKFAEYTFKNRDNCFESDLICNRCNFEFNLDIAINNNYYDNIIDNVSYKFVTLDFDNSFIFGLPIEKNRMNMTCNEMLIKNILE